VLHGDKWCQVVAKPRFSRDEDDHGPGHGALVPLRAAIPPSARERTTSPIPRRHSAPRNTALERPRVCSAI
jgi:hypothetical protein